MERHRQREAQQSATVVLAGTDHHGAGGFSQPGKLVQWIVKPVVVFVQYPDKDRDFVVDSLFSFLVLQGVVRSFR